MNNYEYPITKNNRYMFDGYWQKRKERNRAIKELLKKELPTNPPKLKKSNVKDLYICWEEESECK